MPGRPLQSITVGKAEFYLEVPPKMSWVFEPDAQVEGKFNFVTEGKVKFSLTEAQNGEVSISQDWSDPDRADIYLNGRLVLHRPVFINTDSIISLEKPGRIDITSMMLL